MECFDLSNAQKRTIITEISNPGNEAYIISFKSRYPLEDEEYMKKALSILTREGIQLRIKKDENMNFSQYYADEGSVTTERKNIPPGEQDETTPFTTIDLADKDEEEIGRYIYEFSRKPFKEIFDTPLYQFQLLKTREELLVLGRVHHLVMDGTSLSILARELKNCVETLKNGGEYHYKGVPYREYVEREKEYLSSEEAREDEEFWLSKLEGYSPDWYSSPDLGISREHLKVEGDLRDRLKDLYQVEGERISPFVLALSLVSLYFARSTDSKDLVWNTVYHGRDFGEEIRDMLGMMVNMIPLRLEYDAKRTFKETLLYTKSVLKEGLTHGKLSFNRYGPKLQKKGIDPAMLSMYSIVSNSTDAPLEYLFNSSQSEFPFHIRVNPSLDDKDGLQLLTIEYNKDCFSRDKIQNIVKDLEKILEQIAHNPSLTGDELEVETNPYHQAGEYFKDLVGGSDGATVISPDMSGKEEEGECQESIVSMDKNVLEDFCQQQGITQGELFLAATMFALVKFVFSKDILISINTPMDYSQSKKQQELPYYLKIDTGKSVEDYLRQVHDSFREVVSYDYYPFTRVKSEQLILPEFSYSYGAIQGDLIRGGELPALKMAVNIEEDYENLKIVTSYNDALYSPELVHAFTQSISTLVTKMVKTPEALLQDMGLVDDDGQEEKFQIKPVPEPLLNRLFERQVEKEPDEVALIAQDGEYTYSQLNQMANQIAHNLLKKGVEVEDRVMFILRRDSRLVATMLGIVKAGCAFIPVDPEYPEERIKEMIQDSDARYIVTNQEMPAINLPNAVSVDELLTGSGDTNPEPDLSPENLCFLIYTSGSTGKPKGVMLTHQGITNYINPHPENIPIHALVTRARKMISISTVSFIVFLREMLATLTNGLPVVFASEEQAVNPMELVKLFEETGADAFGATPTRLLQYLEVEEVQKTMPRCRVIIVGGETFPSQLYEKLSQYTLAEIYNSYGPTEVTIACHGKLITSTDITAGDPLLNVTDRIMDIDGNPLPPYAVGELYVAGAGVARGYWNNPELTRERFINYNGLRYYNTGDLAKRDNRGELYVLGRTDTQIKLRGLRIELGEIESTIAQYPGIKAVFAVVRKVQGTEHLVAYFTQEKHVDTALLRNYLLEKLPSYMVPSYLVRMEEFPLTFNGKADLRNFPDPDVDDYIQDEVIPPESDLEEDLLKMCQDILDTSGFGVTTDLFQRGLTSLSVLKLVTMISKKLGVTVSVTSVMRARNIREIAREIESSETSIQKEYPVLDYYPLTQNQLGVYFDCVKNPEKLTYNLPKMIRFKDIPVDRLKKSLEELVEKHPYLKMRLVMHQGEVYQERRDDYQPVIPVVGGRVDDEVIKEFIQPFSLFEGPLFRFKIYSHPDETVLLADFHHLMVDGTSLNILFRDLGAIYDGQLVDVEEYNGYDLSLEEKEMEESQLYSEAREYFEGQVAEFDSATLISPDLKGKEEEGNLGEVGVSFDKDMVEKFCKDNSITPNNLFLAATFFTLSKFVYNRDILISTISNGRGNPLFQETVAMMVKTLPIALNIDSTLTVTEFFKEVQDTWLHVLKYDLYPFTLLSDKYDLFPEFLYAYHGKIIEEVEINGEILERESLEYQTPKFKASVNVVDTGSRFYLFTNYNDALYSRDLMETFTHSLETLVNSFMEDPQALLKDISLVKQEKMEGAQLPPMKPVSEPLMNRLFEKQVTHSRDNLALIAQDGEYTYGQLNQMANQIAHNLLKKGVEVEDRVMFILRRDSRLIATMLGIMKAGCAFIPVDPEYPADRVKHVREDSDARYIITNSDSPNIELPRAINVDELLEGDVAELENPQPDISQDNLCYLIYTSGSTGLPKGVMLTHANITNYVSPDPENCFVHAFVKKARRMLSLTTVAFDAFLHEVMTTLLNSRTLVLASDEETRNPLELVELCRRTSIDCLFATPSRMLQYLEVDGMCEVLSHCRIISIGGEQYPPQLHRKLEECSSAEIYNVYGPTETTISCNTTRITDADNINVGKPLLNVYEEVMDQDGNPLPSGVIGELYVGGMGVARGYWNREELNQKQFITHQGIPYYKTGDFASRDKNGEYHIHGRLDNQIKLRGLRIEIGEIESAISDYEGVENVKVLVRTVQGQDHLCAYFTSKQDIDIEDLKGELKKRLTKYMVPTVFMPLEEMPQTPNGKTDVKNLPEPVLKERVYVPPENEVERFFTNTFSEILDIPQVGAVDDFFELGGTSLLVTRVTIEAMNQGYEIKYGDVFAHPTPRKLAQFINESEKSAQEQEDYSYDTINSLLAENTLENFVKGERTKLGNVLLTGATGFLGIHVLREFLENESGKIYCMLRKGRRTSPEDRLKTLLFFYFSENYEDLFGSRIEVIEGDVTSREDFEKSRGLEIDTVINCAANVKHFAPGTQIEDVNIGGVVKGLEFARKKGCKYVQVSTVSVAGESVGDVPPPDTVFDEKTLYIGQLLDNKYLSSKFLAERLVLEAASEGMDVKIMRMGNLMARHSDSEFQINFETNAFIKRLRSYATIGQIPYPVLGGKVELTPIDLAARAVLLLAQAPRECNVFHVYNSHQIYIGDIVEGMKKVGLTLEGVEEDEFRESFNQALEDETKQEAISGLVTAMGMGKGKDRGLVKVDNQYTTQILYRMGYNWPLINEEYLEMFIKYLKEMNFFD
ncbi:MAG: amino acid adenylation domain-containing protein [Methanobacterium sp.]|jgi:amino acid adenylation domain-containing protein/thioester reductase-like protein|uniref:amino acid adenylation domain-containing protein n=2 Tax=Methanobacterium sp. TaxID=2164 RepID=UPI003D8FFE91